jgi:hypothetical protein
MSPVPTNATYRIRSFSKPELYLELQADNSVQAVKLNDASAGQKWDFEFVSVTPPKYKITSKLNSLIFSVKTFPEKPGEFFPTGAAASTATWTVKADGDHFIISDGDRVLDLANNQYVIFWSANGKPNQKWLIEPVGVDPRTAVKEEGKFLIKNRKTGSVVWLRGDGVFVTFPHDDGDSALYFTFKHLEKGGTSIKSVRRGTWATADLKSSATEQPCRFIPTGVAESWFICPELVSNPPRVWQHLESNKALEIAVLESNNNGQMWDLVLKV